MERFLSKIAVVTGSARGLGERMAAKFCSEGAKVILVDMLEEELGNTVKRLNDAGRPGYRVCRGFAGI